MARNAEKAMTILARWRATQLGEHIIKRRPFLASECRYLPACEKWRMQVIREIARKVSQIQNAGLGEYRIRDLNDEINKLLREKGHWEAQIKELGGPDYAATGPKMLDHEGKEVPGNRGYKYFGAARLLPGVRELFEQAPPPPPRKTRSELMKNIDADYYGYRDDDDGLLIPLEEAEELKAIQAAVDEWNTKHPDGKVHELQEEEADIYQLFVANEDSDTEMDSIETKVKQSFTVHVPVPTQKDIEDALLVRKKQELIRRYCGPNGYNVDDDDDYEPLPVIPTSTDTSTS